MPPAAPGGGAMQGGRRGREVFVPRRRLVRPGAEPGNSRLLEEDHDGENRGLWWFPTETALLIESRRALQTVTLFNNKNKCVKMF